MRVLRLLQASALAIVTALPTVVLAEPIIRCTAAGQRDVTLQINTKRAFGKVLSCIDGDFIEDMEPCAPKGAFGLSYPTGSARLAKVVDRWQDYGGHLGGVTNYNETPTSMSFSGGFMSPSSGYTDNWAFKVDRLTGTGTLTIWKNGKPTADLAYSCGKARRKF